MMAGAALIVVYLIILGGAKGAVLLAASCLLLLFSPAILFILALFGPSLAKKLKGPLEMAARAVKGLLRHMLRPPDR